MRKIIVVLLVLALAGCQSFGRLRPVEKAVVVGAGMFFAGIAGLMVYTAATTPPMSQEWYDKIFGEGLTAGR